MNKEVRETCTDKYSFCKSNSKNSQGDEILSIVFQYAKPEFDEKSNERKVLCEKVFNSFKSFCDIEEIISYIRTIYKDVEEVKLSINYIDTINLKLFRLEIDNNDINKIYLDKNIDSDTRIILEGKTDQLTFGICKNEEKVNIYDTKYDGVIKNIFDEVNTLREYPKIKAKKIDDNAKILYLVYKLFYNETPDFCDDNIELKVQTMISILTNFGIFFKDKYCFIYDFKNPVNLPEDAELSLLIDNLKPFTNLDDITNDIELNERAIRKIKIISENIHSYINENRKLEDILVSLSILLHVKRRQYYFLDDKELSERIKQPLQKVKSDMSLIKKIKTNIDNKQM